MIFLLPAFDSWGMGSPWEEGAWRRGEEGESQKRERGWLCVKMDVVFFIDTGGKSYKLLCIIGQLDLVRLDTGMLWLNTQFKAVHWGKELSTFSAYIEGIFRPCCPVGTRSCGRNFSSRDSDIFSCVVAIQLFECFLDYPPTPTCEHILLKHTSC